VTLVDTSFWTSSIGVTSPLALVTDPYPRHWSSWPSQPITVGRPVRPDTRPKSL